MTNQQFVSVADLAKRLACSPRSIYLAIRAGDLAAIRVNERGDLRIPEAAIRAFIDARSLTAGAPRAAANGD